MIDTMSWGDYPIHYKAIFIFAHHHELFDIKTIAELKEARPMPSYIASSDTSNRHRSAKHWTRGVSLINI